MEDVKTVKDPEAEPLVILQHSICMFGQLRLKAACVILQNGCEHELAKSARAGSARAGAGGSRGNDGGVAKAVARAHGEAVGDV